MNRNRTNVVRLTESKLRNMIKESVKSVLHESNFGIAYNLGRFFVNDIVVSGLAKGIDTSAHKGCLDAKGKTIAVVCSVLMHVHPKENTDLQKRIIESGGLILSERVPTTKASPMTLIARTRLQAALVDKVYVVECENRVEQCKP